MIDRRADPGPDDPLVDIRIIEGPPQPVTVPAGDDPAEEASTEE